MINYEKYRLSRIVTVQEIVSADYVIGLHPSTQYHAHKDAWELCVCLDGETVAIRNNRQYLLAPGHILFIQPGQGHDISIFKNASSAFVVSFTCSNSEYLRPLLDSVLIADDTQLELFRNMIVELEASFEKEHTNPHPLHLFQFVPNEESPLGAEQMICCYLEQMIISLLRSVTMSQGRVVRSGQFREAVQTYLVDQVSTYIKQHLSDKLTVEQIAEHFHYSRARLSTIFKAYTGFGINEMITYQRISRAKVLLAEQQKSITQISEELGFASPQYFSHKFTQAVGCPPSRYVERLEQAAEFVSSASFHNIP